MGAKTIMPVLHGLGYVIRWGDGNLLDPIRNGKILYSSAFSAFLDCVSRRWLRSTMHLSQHRWSTLSCMLKRSTTLPLLSNTRMAILSIRPRIRGS